MMCGNSMRIPTLALALVLAGWLGGPAATAGENNQGRKHQKLTGDQKQLERQERRLNKQTEKTVRRQARQEAKLVKADGMDKKKLRQQLASAPGDTLIEFKGKKMTKKQLEDESARKTKEEEAALKNSPADSVGDPAGVIKRLEQQHKAALASSNAKVKSELSRLLSAPPGGPEALQQQVR